MLDFFGMAITDGEIQITHGNGPCRTLQLSSFGRWFALLGVPTFRPTRHLQPMDKSPRTRLGATRPSWNGLAFMTSVISGQRNGSCVESICVPSRNCSDTATSPQRCAIHTL